MKFGGRPNSEAHHRNEVRHKLGRNEVLPQKVRRKSGRTPQLIIRIKFGGSKTELPWRLGMKFGSSEAELPFEAQHPNEVQRKQGRNEALRGMKFGTSEGGAKFSRGMKFGGRPNSTAHHPNKVRRKQGRTLPFELINEARRK
ncbi:hypothetical protein COCNU_04G006170 [Cocos nucifera]|uniref:Uncharacterized protein n=1 Tax=Cocos nucifera TaxID=13894 RepID=A0A8K0I5N9_COCNU|nr:hypothetical protein COCNU_04G006170 [Cocos nucifera]